MRPIAFTAVCVTACAVSGLLIQSRTTSAPIPPLFADDERAKLVAFWSAPGRYATELPPPDPKGGPWVARLTPEGSTWLLAYQRAVAGARKIPPTQSIKAPDDGPTAGWERWLAAKLAYDWAQARQVAGGANAQLIAAATRTVAFTPDDPAPPAAPGPVPATLLGSCGNPPAFASAVVPMRYTVRLDDSGESYAYTDNVKVPERFAYYRFNKGVVSYGRRVDDYAEDDKARLFRKAGFSDADRRIFAAVSRLEGGFETVQTYDTGYLSVGFIQFVTLAEGKHDLSKVLETEKRESPDAFAEDFRAFGIDVQPDRTLTVVDPATGAELVGPDAVRKLIDDKRLLAVFQRAGRRSEAFQVAQIKVAKSFYWPQDDEVTALLPGGARVTGKVGEVVRSEAGIATLLDRKINTGNLRPFADELARIMAAHGCKTFAAAAAHERELVERLKYRTDFLADKNLGQPGTVAATAPTPPPPAVAPDKPKPPKKADDRDWLAELRRHL